MITMSVDLEDVNPPVFQIIQNWMCDTGVTNYRKEPESTAKY